MNIIDQFFPSALVNAGIFWWLAFLVLVVRVFVSYGLKVSLALFMGALLGPFALLFPWVKGGGGLVKKQKWFSSCLAILVAAILISSLFYFIFVFNFQVFNFSNEILVKNIAIYVTILGFFCGLILAFFTKRIAFFEAVWVTAIFSLLGPMLSSWAEEAFLYGTSTTYFSTILFTITSLLLLFLILGGSVGHLFFAEKSFGFLYEGFIGTRFLMTKRSTNVISLITIISIVAVVIACSGMIIVMSVMNGFSSEFRDKVLSANPHLMLLKYGKDFTEYKNIIEKTKDLPSVLGASAFIVNEGMLSSNKNLAGAMITGLDLLNVSHSGRLKYVKEQAIAYLKNPHLIPVVLENEKMRDEPQDLKHNHLPGVILGKEMALELHVLVGDVVNIISPLGEIGPSGPIPRAKPFLVAGFFESGMYEFDAKFAYISLAEAQDFFNMGKAVTGIEYRVVDVDKTPTLSHQIEGIVGGYPYYTRDWMQLNRPMFSALQLEKIAMMIILSTYIFMASLLILVTLIMVVMEKGKEIAILKSMGATNVSIMKIFVTYGLCIGIVGSTLGGVLGFLLCQCIEKIGIRLDPDVYYFANLPVLFQYQEALLVVAAAVLISFLATIPPALFAASMKPVDGLRYQ